MTKEEQQFQKHMVELANAAYQRGIPMFTNFLERNELHILHSIRTFPDGIRVETSGGYAFAERQMAVFLPDAPFFMYGDMEEFGAGMAGQPSGISYPFKVVHIAPLHPKYADMLTHRDFLGAVLNLGIDRSQIGDLLIEDNACTLFCTPQMAVFLSENCTRIKHTVVSCQEIPMQDFTYTPHFQEIKGSISSMRLDAVLALAFKASRTSMVPHITNGEVFVNSRMEISAGARLHDGDIVSARGFGKFRFDGVLSETKKGRYMVQVSVFQ